MADNDTGRLMLADLAQGAALLTRLPLPDTGPPRADAAWAWPVVGAGIGLAMALVAGLASLLGLTPATAAVLALAAGAVATGALHEDGLADTADGLFGGRTPERRLEIMKDSRIGSYGTLALVLVVLLRWSSITALLVAGQWGALVAAAAVSRAPMAAIMALVPPARPGGLSHATGRPTVRIGQIALALGAALAFVFAGWAGLWMSALAFAAAAGLASLAQARIGGQTGDILGGSQQLAEALALAVAAACLA